MQAPPMASTPLLLSRAWGNPPEPPAQARPKPQGSQHEKQPQIASHLYVSPEPCCLL